MSEPYFKKNESDTDRVIRIAGGITLFVAMLIVGGPLKILFAIMSIALLITGATGFCGLYKLLGISTCTIEKKSQRKNK